MSGSRRSDGRLTSTSGTGRDLAGGRDVSAFERKTHERKTHEVRDAADAAGVRYFDAGRSYGRAEAFLALWLDALGIAAGDVTVGSKWGYVYTGDWRIDADRHEVKDLSADNLCWHRGEPHAGRRPTPAVPDPLCHARERGPRRPKRSATNWPASASRGWRSASRSPGLGSARRLSTRSRLAASIPSRRPGTSWSARPGRCSRPRTRPGSA